MGRIRRLQHHKFAVEGLSEALELELRPFDAKFTITEPGCFRTEFLSAGSIRSATKFVHAYAETTGKTQDNVSAGSGNHAGDRAKSAHVIIKAVESAHPPL